LPIALVGSWRDVGAKNVQAALCRAAYPLYVERTVELAFSAPTIQVVRATTSSLHAGMKEHYGVGRIERGGSEWWGGGKLWRSTPGCVLVKQPGDVVRHVSLDGSITFVAVKLPTDDVVRARGDAKPVAIDQLDPADPRAAPFHRLLDAALAGTGRLALEVAIAEAIDALVVISRASPDFSRPVRRALELMRERLHNTITLEDLASHAELDKFHLCRAFRAQIGLPPHAYLTHLRIARAKQLLLRGVRATDVAPMVGLYDQAQLTRHFRRLVGTTPARYAKS
jgi:AraC-like DNA-binding protein